MRFRLVEQLLCETMQSIPIHEDITKNSLKDLLFTALDLSGNCAYMPKAQSGGFLTIKKADDAYELQCLPKSLIALQYGEVSFHTLMSLVDIIYDIVRAGSVQVYRCDVTEGQKAFNKDKLRS